MEVAVLVDRDGFLGSAPADAARRLAASASWFLWLCAAGCNHHVYSPPARVLPLETVAAKERGELGLTVEGDAATIVFGANVLGGSARARLGVAEDLEGTAEAGAAFVVNEGDFDQHRGIYALRLGLKHRVADSVALTGGLGGGGSVAGGFVGPDLGVVLGYENPYFVPLVSGSVGLSVPFLMHTVRIPGDDDDDGQPTLRRERPSTTLALATQAGFRIPIRSGDAEALSLLAALGVGYLLDDHDDDAIFGASAGLDFAF